jgi:hypothetical protein
MIGNLAALLLAVAVIASPLARAQDAGGGVTDLAALRTAVQADKKAFVASTLQLGDAEAKKFWPIYADFQRDLDAADRQRTRAVEGVIALNKPMSELYARNLARDLMAADEAERRARRTMQNRVLKALPATKAVRYVQLESKIRAVNAYDVAATIPLVR